MSREFTITDEKSQDLLDGSYTFPATFRGFGDKANSAGTLPSGLTLEGNKSIGKRLRKTFKKFKVKPSKNAKANIECLLFEASEEVTEGISELETSNSSTLPTTIRDKLNLNRSKSFGKRIRKTFRKLVVKTPKKSKNKADDEEGKSEENHDIIEALLGEVISQVTGEVECEEEIENLEKAEMRLDGKAALDTHPPQNFPPTVTYEEVMEALKDSTVLVIDVRQPKELKKDGVIPGALNIPLGDLEKALSLRPKKFERKFKVPIDYSTPLVFSCLAGIRSRKAQVVASNVGFTNTSNFTGGWMEWAEKRRT